MTDNTRSPAELRAMFGENLRQLARKYPSISALSRELGINRTQFNRYLGGESFPRADILDRMCRFFDVDARIVLMPLGDIPTSETHHVHTTLTQFLGSGTDAACGCEFPSGFYTVSEDHATMLLYARKLPQCTLIRAFKPRTAAPNETPKTRELRGIAAVSGEHVYMLTSHRDGQNSKIYIVSQEDELWRGTAFSPSDRHNITPVVLRHLGHDPGTVFDAARCLSRAKAKTANLASIAGG